METTIKEVLCEGALKLQTYSPNNLHLKNNNPLNKKPHAN